MNGNRLETIMKGFYLNKQQAAISLGTTEYLFDKNFRSKLKQKENKKRSSSSHARTLLFFVPEELIENDLYTKNMFSVEEDDVDDSILDELEGNVSFTEEEGDEDKQLNRQLKKAKAKKILKQIDVLEERLQRKKIKMYEEWSKEFFQAFQDNFGKLKNVLIDLHLEQDEINKFNQCLQFSLKNLEATLQNMKKEWMEKRGVEEYEE